MPTPIRMTEREDHLIFTGALADESGVIGQERLTQADELGIYVCYDATSVGGSVIIESAPWIGYPGQWAMQAYLPWISAPRAHYVAVTGVHLALRIRIRDPIIGGAVSVYAIGN